MGPTTYKAKSRMDHITILESGIVATAGLLLEGEGGGGGGGGGWGHTPPPYNSSCPTIMQNLTNTSHTFEGN